MIVTLADFLANAPDVDISRYTTATVSGMLSGAQQRAEDYLGYTLARETLTQKLEGIITNNGDLVVFPNKRPINSVSSAMIVKGSFNASLALSSGDVYYYDIPEPLDRIVFDGTNLQGTRASYISFSQLRGATFYVNLTFNAGYDTLPGTISEAIYLYARDSLTRSLNSTGATSISQGALSISYSQRHGKSELVQDAESLLSDYRIIAGF